MSQLSKILISVGYFLICLSYSQFFSFLFIISYNLLLSFNNLPQISTQLNQSCLFMAGKNGYYGYLAGTTTAAILQPLDNIKMALIVPPNKLTLSSNFIKNIYLAYSYLRTEEGWRSFYKGLVVNTLKTGLSSAVYFYLLRTIEKAIPESSASNFTASAMARIASAIVSNPLGVIQARYEISGAERWSGSILKNLYKIYSVEGMQGFFKGCLATCLKQASFAGLYYMLYSQGKSLGFSSVLAGMSAGMISTFVTHPFEILRTNIQVYLNFHNGEAIKNNNNLMRQLSNLLRQKKLLDGVAPRLIKKPLANTLAFCLFEYMQRIQQNKHKS